MASKNCNEAIEERNSTLVQFERNKYFYGKLMSVRDFQLEQDYFNGKRHLLNRLIHGVGLVCGGVLKDVNFSTDNDGDLRLEFPEAAVAVDCWGREIVIPEGTLKKIMTGSDNPSPLKLDILDNGKPYYLYLKYNPCLKDRVPALSNASTCEQKCCYSRIKEDFEVVLCGYPPDPIVIKPAKEAQSYFDSHLNTCPKCTCTDPKVLLAVVEKNGTSLKINVDETYKYRSIVYNNPMLFDLISSHVVDYNNPHKTLKSVNGQMGDTNRNVDLLPATGSAITINSENNKITIGEDHSGKQVDPENQDPTRDKHVSNADAHRWNSAVYKINGIQPNAAGNFTIQAGSNISITPGTNQVTISSEGGGELISKAGRIQVKLDDNGVPDNILEVDPKFENRPYCVYLGLIMPDQKDCAVYGTHPLCQWLYAQVYQAGSKRGKFDVHVKVPTLEKQTIIILWWAIPGSPTSAPTIGPTVGPTFGPTIGPTIGPTFGPTIRPTIGPTFGPTIGPTIGPTFGPTIGPIVAGSSPTVGAPVTIIARPVVEPMDRRPVTEVGGIGEAYEGRLREGGISNLTELASAAPERVAKVLNIRVKKAKSLIENAKRLIG